MSWFTDFFDRSRTTPPGEAGVRSVRFDTKGLRVERRASDTIEWVDRYGDRAIATLERNAPDGSTNFPDIAALRAHHRAQAAARDAGIVSVDLIRAARSPVVRVITKIEANPTYDYTGSLIVALKGARFTLTLHTREHDTTGMREAVLTSFLLSRGLLQIPTGSPGSGPRRLVNWFYDPYDAAHDDEAVCSVADDERLDPLFEKHPLTKLRQWLKVVADSLTIDDTVRQSVAEDACAPTDPATRLAETMTARTLGVLYVTAGRPDAAEAMLLSGIPMADGEPLESNAEVANALMFVGFAREMQGRLADAEWAFVRSHRMLQVTAGDQDIQTARAASSAGRMRVARECFEEAEPLLGGALAIFEAQGSPSDSAVAMNELGLICQGRHEHRPAIAWFEQAAARFEEAERNQGKPIPDRARVLNNLGRSLDELGDRRGAAAARARARQAGPAA